MPTWILKLLHVIGLTNLTDEQVAQYAGREIRPRFSITRAPIIDNRSTVPMIRSGRLASVAAGQGR